MCPAPCLSGPRQAPTVPPSMSAARIAVAVYASGWITEPAAMVSAVFRARGYRSVPSSPQNAEGRTESNQPTLTVTSRREAPPGAPPLRGPESPAGARRGPGEAAQRDRGPGASQPGSPARCPGVHAACSPAMLALCGPLTPCRPPGGHHCGARPFPRPVVPARPAGLPQLGPGGPVGLCRRGHRRRLPGRGGRPHLLRRPAQAALSRTSCGTARPGQNIVRLPSGRIRRMSVSALLSGHRGRPGDGKSVTCSADTVLSRT